MKLLSNKRIESIFNAAADRNQITLDQLMQALARMLSRPTFDRLIMVNVEYLEREND